MCGPRRDLGVRPMSSRGRCIGVARVYHEEIVRDRCARTNNECRRLGLCSKGRSVNGLTQAAGYDETAEITDVFMCRSYASADISPAADAMSDRIACVDGAMYEHWMRRLIEARECGDGHNRAAEQSPPCAEIGLSIYIHLCISVSSQDGRAWFRAQAA
ncbi:hypothetical protein PENSPDRAFT_83649 [Peniophora sp. CONT]|nr:hypothetical protein PENSPDRAFT_83649 [Peniophora sp. CONT]